VSYSRLSGQSSTVLASVATQTVEKVNVTCGQVIDSTGAVVSAATLGITCTSPSTPLTSFPPTTNQQGQTIGTPITVVVKTNGFAASLRPFHVSPVVVCLTLPGLLLFGFSRRSLNALRSRRWINLCGLLVLSFSLTACGGGFSAPQLTGVVTKAGIYQVNVITTLDPSTPDPNFVQTTLIVPLNIAPFQ
jgi:hypothetical protein